MSQRLLIIIFSFGLVAAVGISAIVSSGITSSMIASATIAGPAGADGADGADGATGAQGLPGANGKDGAPGATGASGSGPTGPAGAQGTPGAAGSPGASGAAGAPGVPGQDATATPPLTLRTGPLTTAFPASSAVYVTGAGLFVPAGTYALSVTIADALFHVSSGGADYASGSCFIRPVGSLQLYFTREVEADLAASQVISIATDTTLEVQCSVFAFDSISADLTWSQLTISATRLD